MVMKTPFHVVKIYYLKKEERKCPMGVVDVIFLAIG